MGAELGARKIRVVLASQSPRRLELLRRIGFEPVVSPANIDESVLPGEEPVEYVERLARAKAAAVAARHSSSLVVAADTTVDVDGEILGQPRDIDDARRMLKKLSGRTHRVHTAVAVYSADKGMQSKVVTSLVSVVPMSDHLLEWYLASGEPMGKAGSYAVQGAGGVLVSKVQGSLSNVVGLPLRETARLLAR